MPTSTNAQTRLLNRAPLKHVNVRAPQLRLVILFATFSLTLMHYFPCAKVCILTQADRVRGIASKAAVPTAKEPAPPHAQISDGHLREITRNNDHLIYVRAIDTLLMTMAKGASSSIFEWLYAGLTGQPRFNSWRCGTYVQNVSSPCWHGHVKPVYALPTAEQRNVLFNASARTLRIAVQRDPYSRMMSLFRDKVSCNRRKYGEKAERERNELVATLREQAMTATGVGGGKAGCMDVEEFARTVDAIRRGIMEGRVQASQLDVHLQPQEFFFDRVDYDIVLDVSDLNDAGKLRPVLGRLPFRDAEHVKAGPGRAHKSDKAPVVMKVETEALLRRFAAMSKVGRVKFAVNKFKI